MTHVLARLTGYGVALVPYWPYEFAVDGAGVVEVTRWTPDGPRRGVVDPARPESVDGIVDVSANPDATRPEWWIETSAFSVAMPAGYRLTSPRDATDRKAFYLLSDDGIDIFPQGPVRNDRIPPTDRLVAPGQRLVAERTLDGVTLVELAYEHEGRDWWQGHHQVPVGPDRTLVFTAQAPAALAGSAKRAVAALIGMDPFE